MPFIRFSTDKAPLATPEAVIRNPHVQPEAGGRFPQPEAGGRFPQPEGAIRNP